MGAEAGAGTGAGAGAGAGARAEVAAAMSSKIYKMIQGFVMLIFCTVCSLPSQSQISLLRHCSEAVFSAQSGVVFCLGEVIFRHYSVIAQFSH